MIEAIKNSRKYKQIHKKHPHMKLYIEEYGEIQPSEFAQDSDYIPTEEDISTYLCVRNLCEYNGEIFYEDNLDYFYQCNSMRFDDLPDIRYTPATYYEPEEYDDTARYKAFCNALKRFKGIVFTE